MTETIEQDRPQELEKITSATHKSRPKIGLALGGGAARGWAHIGVLRSLIRAGFAPDIVAGTSIGALVGGLYLADHLNELEEWARQLTRRRMLSLVDLTLGNSGALMGGKQLETLLTENVGDLKIEDLPKRFVAVTTELATGHEIWLRDGSLARAMRASFALPGIFSPTKIDDRWLIDGALVNPVPVSVCRAFGARLVIAVNLNADQFGAVGLEDDSLEQLALSQAAETGSSNGLQRTGLPVYFDRRKPGGRKPGNATTKILRQLFGSGPGTPGLSTVMTAAINIMQDRLSRSRLAGDPPDAMITPAIAHVGLMDFHRAEEMIERGEEAAEQCLPFLRHAFKILS